MNRILIAVIALLSLGCQMDKKFAKVQPGMTKSEVIGILGKPNGFKNEPGSETLTWEAGNHYVKFKDGRVAAKGIE